ncbi:MAG: hypothetical protein AAFZ15_14200 [Bacteroidota bacterium]
MLNRSNLSILLLLALLILWRVFESLFPEIIGSRIKDTLDLYLPVGYEWGLLGIFILISSIVIYQSSDFLKKYFPSSLNEIKKNFNIPITAANLEYVNEARTAIENAEPETALRFLSEINIPTLKDEVTLLSTQWVAYNRSHPQINISDRDYIKVNKNIIQLIAALEKELHRGAEIYQTIQDYLKKRYENRLRQKLAGRQPVNIRRFPTKVGTSEETAELFVPYQEGEIQDEMSKVFRDAYGRLLVLGIPGSGKTTLLLRWVIQLLDEEKYALPVIVNLATWRNEFVTFETWLQEILPTELGVSKYLAKELLKHDRFILLCDGLDEIKTEDRNSLLAAMGKYGSVNHRRFVISSRVEEYMEVEKDAPVNLTIEVGALTMEQLKTELNKMAYLHTEAKRLSYALEKDEHLRAAVQTPFYFNTLQLLFANGIRLSDLNFSANSKEGREKEIKAQFIEFALEKNKNINHRRWLAFLASRLNLKNLVSFELVDFQYDWWRWSKTTIRMGAFIETLTSGFVGVFVPAIFLAPMILYIFINFYGFEIGLKISIVFIFLIPIMVNILLSFISNINSKSIEFPTINTRDNIHWSLKSIYLAFKINFKSVLFAGTITGIPIGLIFWTRVGVLFGIVIGMMAMLLVVFGFTAIALLSTQYFHFLQINKPYKRFKASAKALYFSIFQHRHLMSLFQKHNLLPKKIVPFLTDMTDRHLLESDGASWRFRHRILQDYFAGEWERMKNEE